MTGRLRCKARRPSGESRVGNNVKSALWVPILPALVCRLRLAINTCSIQESQTRRHYMAFGPTGVNESFLLGIGSGDVSEPFAVPAGFTGHVYVHGVGGNQMAVFVVGSDGDAELWGNGGFFDRIGQ